MSDSKVRTTQQCLPGRQKTAEFSFPNDVTTITACAYDRIEKGKPVPGVVEVTRGAGIGQIIADLILIEECGTEGEFSNQIIYLPFP